MSSPLASARPPSESQSRIRTSDILEPAVEGALDALGAVLQMLGRYSFDVGEERVEGIRKTFERLTQHALVGAPLGGEGDPQGGRRDWNAVRRTVMAHRKREVDYVVKAVGDLRKTVEAFAMAFARTLEEDGRGDQPVKEQLRRLEAAVRSPDTASIRKEAQATIRLVGESIERRAERHQSQLLELSTHVRTLTEELQQAKKAGEIDGLTRLPIRACFDDYVGKTAELAALCAEPLCIFMVDVDHFKSINDTGGHAAGDAALRAVADTLARCFPRRGDLVARFGGDEFAVVLRGVTAKDARLLASRCVDAVRALRIEHAGRTVQASVSVGFATFRPGDVAASWLGRADAALYRAKQGGRDRWAEAASDVPTR